MARERRQIAPDWVTLRVLMKAAETGSLSQAARDCSIALSAAARRIQMLEAECGVTLLERRARGVRPTAAGETFLRHAVALTELASRLSDDMHAFAAGGGGSVRLHATTSAIVGHGLSAIVAAFAEANPSILVEAREATSAAIIRDVADGRADLGVVTSGNHVLQGCTAHPWRDDQLFVVMRADHPLARRRSLDFATVLDYPLIGAIEGGALSVLLAQEAALLGRELHYRFRVAQTEAARSMIAAGLGIGIQPEGMFRPSAATLGLRGVKLAEPWARRRLHLVSPPDSRLSPPARALLRHLLADRHLD